MNNIIQYIYPVIAAILVITFHEFSHALASYLLGDPTAKQMKRLSLNPFRHFSVWGILLYVVMVAVFHIGFGFAKPVMFNSDNFKNPKRDVAIVSLAGPLSNFVLCIVFSALYGVFSAYYFITANVVLNILAEFSYNVIVISLSLGLFNLIPIPPLDGSRILSAFLPPKYYYKLMQYERYLFILVMALIWSGVLDRPLDFLSSGIMNGLSFVAGLPFKMI